MTIKSMIIFGVNEIITYSEEVIKSIESVPEWKA